MTTPNAELERDVQPHAIINCSHHVDTINVNNFRGINNYKI